MVDDQGSREKLIEVAGRLFSEKGLDGVTTRDIAGEAQVNISLISYYFQGKEGLYRAVMEDFALKAQATLQKVLAEIDTDQLNKQAYTQIMRSIIQGIAKMKIAHPYMSALMTRELLDGLPMAREIHEKVFSSMGEKMLSFLETAQKKKIIRKDIHLPTMFISMILSMDSYFLAGRCDTSMIKLCYKLPENLNEYTEQIVKIFVEGVLE